jgi:hypothetical protein
VTSTKGCIDDIPFHGTLASITDADVSGLMLLLGPEKHGQSN